MTLRVVFDTNVVLSALRFQSGRLAWLRGHWTARDVHTLASNEVVSELIRALAYPKFQLSPAQIQELLADFLPHVHVIEPESSPKTVRCRDPDDQLFLDLAVAGRADVLVTGDKDLLALKGKVPFAVETPAEYELRFARTVSR